MHFSGGGVGKSHLIKSIYQAALKHYNSRAGEDFRHIQILLLASTGKAAYLIKGNYKTLIGIRQQKGLTSKFF